MQSVEDKVIRSIRAKKNASVFSSKHFSDFGSSTTVSKALSSLANNGKIKRLIHGLYYLPRKHPILGETTPDVMEVIQGILEGSSAIWQVSGAYATNLLGLSTQVPAKVVVLTDGVSKKIRIENLTIDFRHASPKNMLGAGNPEGTIIQAIRYLKKDGITPSIISHLQKSIDKQTKKRLKAIIPDLAQWMQPILKEICN